jgi:hypothetical protein
MALMQSSKKKGVKVNKINSVIDEDDEYNDEYGTESLAESHVSHVNE